MKVAGWVAAGTWPAVVEAMQRRPASDELVLVAVADTSEGVPTGPLAGLMGRGRRASDAAAVDQLGRAAAQDLLDQAVAALGRPCEAQLRTGFTEREVTAAAAAIDLLIVARDGDRTRLGPRSLGRHTRFVIDHAPCTVAVVWPGEAPGLDSIPAPPPDR
ncbi:MAG TPA: universal stress protein [Propionicimonas sp.]|nr:universal stress protein [Propionicimonas sp.]